MATNATYTHNVGNAEEAADAFKTIADGMLRDIEGLQQKLIAGLADWHDEGSDSFHQTRQRWETSANDISSRLSIAVQTIHTTSDHYTNMSKAASNTFPGGR